MNITKIILISVFCLFIILLLKRLNSDYAMYVSATAGIIICFFSLGILKPVFDYAQKLCESEETGKMCTVMFKSAGICLLCTVAAEICRDCNESSLASKIELAGKCTLLTYCLPLIKTVFEYVSSFVN